jgi:hypothetical protein
MIVSYYNGHGDYNYIPHYRPRREDVLRTACPVCGARPQQWCRRRLDGKDLKITTRNQRLMADRTPPSHLERYRLWQVGGTEVRVWARSQRRRGPARPGRRERQGFRP